MLSRPIVTVGQFGNGGWIGGGYMPGSGPKPQAKTPPPPQNQQSQKNGIVVWCPSLSVVSIRVFEETPGNVLVEESET